MIETPNLDCMELDDLREFRDSTDNERLRDYCQFKILAMRFRLAGEVNRAIRHEAKCDRIYSDLPDYLRW